jgi:hypothetical protein
MKVAIVAPVNLLSKYCNTGIQLCYASLVLSNNEYSKFYKDRSAKDTIIMDSSPNVPRRPIPFTFIIEATHRVKPHFLVLPNFEYSAKKTLELSARFIKTYGNIGCKYIGMLQGHDFTSIMECYHGLKDICSAIGLPSSCEPIRNRNLLIRELGITKPVIFFDVYDNPIDELPTRNNIMCICTSLPVRLGFEGRDLGDFKGVAGELDFDSSGDSPLIGKNIKHYKKLLGTNEEV